MFRRFRQNVSVLRKVKKFLLEVFTDKTKNTSFSHMMCLPLDTYPIVSIMKKNRNFLGKYVDICTDFGMKLYFGPDGGKPNLINFLNGLFEGEKVIKDLEYESIRIRSTEQV